MATSLRRLLVDCRKYDLKLVAGEEGLDNHVRWVHVVEDKEVPTFLHGFELVFTTGIGIKAKEDFDFKAVVDSLIEHNASGWVINEGPYINKVPLDLIEYCNNKRFPLFTIPWKERLIDVTYDISHAIIAGEEKVASISESFSNIIFSSGDTMKNIEMLDREGYKSTDKYQIIFIDPMIDQNHHVIDIRQIEPMIYSLAKYIIFNENGNIVIVMDNPSFDDIEYIVDQIEKNCGIENASFKIGISNLRGGILELPKLYKEAMIASDYAKLKDIHYAEYKKIGAYQIVGQIDDDSVIDGFIHDCLYDVKEYDKSNNTNYLEILSLYIKYDGSIIKIAEHLGVHRNTINYKIKFIKSYFNIDISIEELAKIYLAIIMNEMKRR